MTIQRWLARLSFSFFIIAALLFWEVYQISQGSRGSVPAWRISLYLLGIVLSVTLGALGIRAKHRSDDNL